MNKRILNGLFFVGSFTLVGCTATDSMPTETKQPAPKINSVSAEVISSWIDSKVLAPEGLSLEQDNLRYLSGSADLNSDGKAEHIVLLQDRYFCGSGGCSAYMFDNEGNVINRMSVTRTPIVLADSYSNGWQDFIVWNYWQGFENTKRNWKDEMFVEVKLEMLIFFSTLLKSGFEK